MNNRLPFVLYVLFIISWFLHLPARYEFLAPLRIDLLLVVLIFALARGAQRDGELSPMERKTRTILWVLAGYAFISIPFIEWPGSVIKNGFPQFIKAVVFFYFTVTLVRTPERLRVLLWVFVLCQMFRVFEPVYLHLTDGYWGSRASMADWESMDRLSGAPSDVVNPNGLAAIVLTILPFLHYLSARRVPLRLFYVLTVPVLVYGMVLTASRSGMIGFAAIVFLVWLQSRHKLLLLAIVSAAIVFTIPRLPPDLADRYLSIVSSNTKNAATAGERSEFMAADFQVAMQRPIFGHGLGTSSEANANYEGDQRPSHNLYVEIAQELGFVGLLIFIWYMTSLYGSLRALGRMLAASASAPPIARSVVPALWVWFGVNVLFSFASYGLCSYEWYFAAGLVEVTGRMIQLPQQQPVPAENRASAVALAPVTVRS